MIYFIQCGENGPIKIGQTSNGIEERVKQLQTGCPYELRVLWAYRGSDYSESDLHEIFSHERISGEWFHPSTKLFFFMHFELYNKDVIDSNYGEITIEEAFYHPSVGRGHRPHIVVRNNLNGLWTTHKDAGVVIDKGWKITYPPEAVKNA